ncbi:hypothetical protein AUR64_04240 [Haloprofundus marisrubri]|uniref:ABC transporter permease n=1 Tax=Haloprofundus marisrubri TaxID=1514971 RepID=A0A0W1RDC3_9EURY|nr:hypothetical protein [Haloprofundus marisrubri]KTG11470.1 hypothetical protein AUR64_04240 [Haloprofundus marisrubri]
MSTATSPTQRLTDAGVSILLTIRKSFLSFVMTLGLICLLFAALFSEAFLPVLNNGVLAGMFVIWGVSAFVYAVLGYVVLRLIGYN